jgi:hypothetical protein
MKIFDARDEHGNLIYFEISNTYLSRMAAYNLVAKIHGVEIIKRPRVIALFGDDDIFCVFRIGEKTFELWEPFGDNSQFHVATSPLSHCAELDIVKNAFLEYRLLTLI